MTEILKWLITVVVGGAIAFAWQKRGWFFQQKLKRTTDLYESQISLVKDIFSLVDKRIYISRIYLTSIIDNSPDISSERDLYKKVVLEWNEKISGLIILSLHRFNSRIAYDFDIYFPRAFSELDRKLRELRLQGEKGNGLSVQKMESIRSDLSLLNIHARDFMDAMVSHIDNTRKSLEEEPRISHSNASDLSYWYLIKSIFKSRLKF